MINKQGIETERKFLIEYPINDFLLKCQKYEIVQTYLNSTSIERRVRKITHNNKTIYIYTTKEKLASLSRLEKEIEITEDKYNLLLKEIKKDNYSLKKTRYVYEANNLRYEIDIYPFWNDKAILEVELKSAEDYIPPVKEIKIIKEVSLEKGYRNTYLATLSFLNSLK